MLTREQLGTWFINSFSFHHLIIITIINNSTIINSWEWYLQVLERRAMLRSHCYSNSSFWGQGSAVLVLDLKQTWILMRKLHVRLAFMLTVTFECLKTEYCRRSTWSGWKTGTLNSRGLSYWTIILRPARQDYFTPCGGFGRLLVSSLQITNVLLSKNPPCDF